MLKLFNLSFQSYTLQLEPICSVLPSYYPTALKPTIVFLTPIPPPLLPFPFPTCLYTFSICCIHSEQTVKLCWPCCWKPVGGTCQLSLTSGAHPFPLLRSVPECATAPVTAHCLLNTLSLFSAQEYLTPYVDLHFSSCKGNMVELHCWPHKNLMRR